MDLYREQILDHYKNPRNFGEMKDADAEHEEYNYYCGDRVVMKVKVENFKLKNVRFSGEGCAICIAGASMLTEYAQGKTVRKLQKADKSVMLSLLGINPTPTRLKCALLPLEALQKAIQNIKTNKTSKHQNNKKVIL